MEALLTELVWSRYMKMDIGYFAFVLSRSMKMQNKEQGLNKHDQQLIYFESNRFCFNRNQE